MKKALLPLLILSSVINTAHAADWFKDSDALTQVHKHLLDNDLALMFDSLVEVWQINASQSREDHLNQLFEQALNKDCGKTLTKNTLPDWISSVVVKRHIIQSPGRETFRVAIDVESESNIQDITFEKWVDKVVSSDSEFTKGNPVINNTSVSVYSKRYSLASQLDSGLYRLTVKGNSGNSWSTWVILGEVVMRQQVRWASKDSWLIDKKALLNPYCPLPKLDVGLYDYVDERYKQVWGKSYESDYPTNLTGEELPNDRYVLAVSMVHSRWQGDIAIEQAQTISKTYDISSEE
ncbi:DUF2861 family protein [Vibrio sp. 10N.222.54.F12]|uniref:DUF2861 family protein n=2 Tax=Vibrio TaxID=662 RepID=A0A1C3J1P8_9VIBR|nr:MULTISPECIES: DUF2861 family protein [Vibrio]OEF59358.1 hypothetical protein A163_01785 [Vibrio tasmaniensis 1F-267]OEF71901.1 hypothetical protein A152_13460 [Vibrio tasmaniensis 1F-187]OEF78868.1 hypothetical protein A162_15975 [Vibrio tasmaniensis 1F-155]PML16593.1 hypothetical protein BCT83_11370 [Vibrio tasmaniensis]PML52438.1 hypothetical protein BCT76_00825 [Vibrio tasmaniensis]